MHQRWWQCGQGQRRTHKKQTNERSYSEKTRTNMNEAVKIFSVLIFLTGITHVALFIITNKLRIKRLLTLVENFRNANLLTKSDYQYLRDRYTGFLSHMESFPDKADYKVMYDNPE